MKLTSLILLKCLNQPFLFLFYFIYFFNIVSWIEDSNYRYLGIRLSGNPPLQKSLTPL